MRILLWGIVAEIGLLEQIKRVVQGLGLNVRNSIKK